MKAQFRRHTERYFDSIKKSLRSKTIRRRRYWLGQAERHAVRIEQLKQNEILRLASQDFEGFWSKHSHEITKISKKEARQRYIKHYTFPHDEHTIRPFKASELGDSSNRNT